jgi:hypothetical protein
MTIDRVTQWLQIQVRLLFLSTCLELTFSVATGNAASIDSAEDPARRNELERKWRTVLALNILVSTINGHGHPIFFWKPSIQPQEDRTKSFQHSLLKYIVAILVRKNEIIAAVAHKPKVSTNAQPGAYQVNIMGANPHNVKLLEQDPYFANVPHGIDYLVLGGKSHLLDSNSEDTTLWARILKIR